MKHLFFCWICIFILTATSAMAQNNPAHDLNNFGFGFYKQISNSEKNLFYSPYSISLALAMTYEGAENETADQMQRVLHFPESKKELRRQLADEMREITHSPDEKNYIFRAANGIWASEKVEFKQAFIDKVKEYYRAPFETVDFYDDKMREKARRQMNKWTEKNTEGKIKKLITDEDLTPLSVMVLINAVYFKAQWDKTFNESRSKEDNFYSFDSQVKAEFMHQTQRFKYYSDNMIQAVEIPYYARKASIHVFLPKNQKSFRKFIEKLDNDYFEKIKEKSKYRQVNIKLPKFKTKSRLYLEKHLSEAGMPKAFRNDADFSGMSKSTRIAIDKVIHQSYIDLNEDGTEAAAATAVVMKRTSAVPSGKPLDFKADKPFIYLIKDNETNRVIFMGQLVNPQK